MGSSLPLTFINGRKVMNDRIIRTTDLRKLYSFFRFFSTKTQLAILGDYNRGKNYKKLVKIYSDSKKYFEQYSNYEAFIEEGRKRSEVSASESPVFNNTKDVIAFFNQHDQIKVENDDSLTFSYIEREIDPRRMTGAKYDDGSPGRSSGTGGIDFLAWNDNMKLPIIGEIKCKSDETPFFALIQLLMYCSEMATESQVKRINNHQLFKREIKLPYLLYIFLGDFNLGGKKGNFKKPLKTLIPKIVEDIDDIKDIIILDAKKENNIINRL
jgi:hypothetical protein